MLTTILKTFLCNPSLIIFQLFILVPSRAPSNIRLSNVRAGEVKVQWDALSQQYINGRLLGYTVYYEEYPYYYSYLRQSVNTSSANVYMVILRGMKAAQQYRINVAAYTSKGVGPQSYSRYITTGKTFSVYYKGALAITPILLVFIKTVTWTNATLTGKYY